MTEAPELLFFSGHGTSSAHPSPSTVKQTMENVSGLRAKLASGSVHLALVGNCSTGKSTLINAWASETRLGHAKKSVDKRPITLWDTADDYGTAQINDELIELASGDKHVVSLTGRGHPAANAASSRATDRLLLRPRSGESTRDDLIWPDLSVRGLAAFRPWSRYASAAVQPITLAQSFEYGCQSIVVVPCPPAQNLREILGCRAFRLTFQEDALPTGSTAFLRFIDGILAALRLMLVLVLIALSQQLDARDFVLVILAACLRYGRHEEPDDHAFLPMRRNQTSLEWCSPG